MSPEHIDLKYFSNSSTNRFNRSCFTRLRYPKRTSSRIVPQIGMLERTTFLADIAACFNWIFESSSIRHPRRQQVLVATPGVMFIGVWNPYGFPAELWTCCGPCDCEMKLKLHYSCTRRAVSPELGCGRPSAGSTP